MHFRRWLASESTKSIALWLAVSSAIITGFCTANYRKQRNDLKLSTPSEFLVRRSLISCCLSTNNERHWHHQCYTKTLRKHVCSSSFIFDRRTIDRSPRWRTILSLSENSFHWSLTATWSTVSGRQEFVRNNSVDQNSNRSIVNVFQRMMVGRSFHRPLWPVQNLTAPITFHSEELEKSSVNFYIITNVYDSYHIFFHYIRLKY